MGELIAPLTKRALIGKANSRMVITISIAAFVVVFSAVAAKTLISRAIYQNRVIAVKRQARTTLDTDLAARDKLVGSYLAFVSTEKNAIGGDPKGSGDRDGDNAKIVLDALPSGYDFPALATSLEKLVTSQGLTIQSISGTDDEVAQAKNATSENPQPQAVAFQLVVSGSYPAIQSFVNSLERSIRPIQIKKVEVQGSEGAMRLTLDAQTYFQPQKNLKIRTEVVK